MTEDGCSIEQPKMVAAVIALREQVRSHPYLLGVGCFEQALMVYLRRRESFHDEVLCSEVPIPTEVDGYRVEVRTPDVLAAAILRKDGERAPEFIPGVNRRLQVFQCAKKLWKYQIIHIGCLSACLKMM